MNINSIDHQIDDNFLHIGRESTPNGCSYNIEPLCSGRRLTVFAGLLGYSGSVVDFAGVRQLGLSIWFESTQKLIAVLADCYNWTVGQPIEPRTLASDNWTQTIITANGRTNALLNQLTDRRIETKLIIELSFETVGQRMNDSNANQICNPLRQTIVALSEAREGITKKRSALQLLK